MGERRAIGSVVVTLVVLGSACSSHLSPGPSPRDTTTIGRSSSPSASPGTSRSQAWAQDVAYLIQRMESLHPDLYHGVSKAELAEAAHSLVTRLPTLRDDQILVGMMHLLALISSDGRDGHMGIWPPDNPDVVHRYPIRVWEFPDGLYVTAARAPNQTLAGRRIVAIDGVPIREVFERLDAVVPRDNDSNLRAARSVFLTSAEVLSGLGIGGDPTRLEVEVTDPSGAMRTVTVGAVDAATFAGWVGGWELALPARDGMLLFDDPTKDHWTRYIRPARALYVQYNEVRPSSADVVAEIQADLASHDVQRIVLDLRTNGGGEAEGYRQLLAFLAHPGSNLSGGLYILIGRLTFSAAASFVAEMERSIPDAVLVGEATGGAPNFWADVDTVTLPNSGLTALVSTTYEGYGTPNDPRLAIAPDVPVDLTAPDYFSSRDPVLEAALAAP
jgi:hypothetical protein